MNSISKSNQKRAGAKSLGLLINVSKEKTPISKDSSGKIIQYKIALKTKVEIIDINQDKKILDVLQPEYALRLNGNISFYKNIFDKIDKVNLDEEDILDRLIGSGWSLSLRKAPLYCPEWPARNSMGP